MATRVEARWHFDSQTGRIVGTERPDRDLFMRVGRVNIIYQLGPKTKLDSNLGRNWWNQKPISITYQGFLLGKDPNDPPVLKVKKIAPAPVGASEGQIA